MTAPIAIAGFQGQIPRAHKRVLPGNAAQVAMNCSFKAGTVAPLKKTALTHTFGADMQTIFLHDGTWLGWAADVSVVRGPVATDRIYYTGDGAPKMRAGGTVYDLALPAPSVAPTVTNLTSPSGSILETVLYAYTWVTGFGEESPPSPLSAEASHEYGVTQRVSGFGTPPAGRNVTHIRIYRSQTASSGATALYFAAEIAVATTQYDYDSTTMPLGEVIPSTDYDTPPAGLAGLTSLPNGLMAAFSGKDLYFCEPYIPHAWPEKYVLTVDFDIVGLVGFGSNLAVLTEGTPYVAQGLSPDNMALEKLEAGLPCVSRRGIVDLGYAALYPSADGLVLISGNETQIITEGLFTREQWRDLVPSSISAARFERKYLFTRNVSSYDLMDGGDPAGWGGTLETTLDNDEAALTGVVVDYVDYDFGAPASSFGDQRVGVIDMSNGAPSFSDTDFAPPASMYFDDPSANLYLLDEDLREVRRWEDEDSATATVTWRSKLFTSNVPVAYGAIFVRTARPLATGDTFEVDIIAGDSVIHTITAANRTKRLPARKLATEWEIEIRANVEVVSVVMGMTPDDVMMQVA